MDLGGHVDPPDHLHFISGEDLPLASGRGNYGKADYDSTVFRYSRGAPPCLFLLMAVAAILLALTFLQGPFGTAAGRNGLRAGQPRDYYLANGADWDLAGATAGVKDYLYYLRAFNFALGVLSLLACAACLLARLSPRQLRLYLLPGALGLAVLFCTSTISFGLSLLGENTFKICPDLTFNNEDPAANRVHISPGQAQHPFSIAPDNPYSLCDSDTVLGLVSIAADAAQAVFAALACGLLLYTTRDSQWAWGTGYIPTAQRFLGPPYWRPPLTPFTHVASTRQLYVVLAFASLAVSVGLAFCVSVAMESARTVPRLVDRNNFVLFTPGWPVANSLLRGALGGLTLVALGGVAVDMIAVRMRVLALLLAALLLALALALLAAFGLDVGAMATVTPRGCPRGEGVEVTCHQARYIGTALTELFLAAFLILYVGCEYYYRITRTWGTYYFFADSEWLRGRSLFIPDVTAFAPDWRPFALPSGEEYYYSAALGLSTLTEPEGYDRPQQEVPPEPVVFSPVHAPAARPALKGAPARPGPWAAVYPPGTEMSTHLAPYPAPLPPAIPVAASAPRILAREASPRPPAARIAP